MLVEGETDELVNGWADELVNGRYVCQNEGNAAEPPSESFPGGRNREENNKGNVLDRHGCLEISDL